MEQTLHNKRSIRTDKLLLLMVIGIGFFGISRAYQGDGSKVDINIASYHTMAKQILTYADQPIDIRGSFIAGDPIRFTFTKTSFENKSVIIDFGNGTRRTLTDSTFTFAYQQKGSYRLSVKNEGKILYTTQIQINEATSKTGEFVMN